MSTFLKPFKQTMSAFHKGIEVTSPERRDFISYAMDFYLLELQIYQHAVFCAIQYSIMVHMDVGNVFKNESQLKWGRDTLMFFSVSSENPKGPLRTDDSVLQDARKVIQQKETSTTLQHVNCLKGPSWLLLFPNFSIVDGIAIDYMYGVLLGVQTLLLRLWFDKSFIGKPFNFHNLSSQLDK